MYKIKGEIHNILDFDNYVYLDAYWNVDTQSCECLFISNKVLPEGYYAKMRIGWISLDNWLVIKTYLLDHYPTNFTKFEIYQVHFPDKIHSNFKRKEVQNRIMKTRNQFNNDRTNIFPIKKVM